jgi:spermidine synthase
MASGGRSPWERSGAPAALVPGRDVVNHLGTPRTRTPLARAHPTAGASSTSSPLTQRTGRAGAPTVTVVRTATGRAATTTDRPGGAERVVVIGIAVAVAATGACGLVYQQLWMRQLSLVFGTTVEAVALALSTFMAGIALGSLAAGRLADTTPTPLRWFGISELCVGVLALATPAALRAVERAYVAAADTVGTGSLLSVIRAVLAFGVLVVPASVMGASTPLVLTAASRRPGSLGRRAALLYAANTAGAIAGCLAAGAVLIGGIGITVSFRLAAAVNIVVGLTIVAVSWRLESPARTPAPQEADPAGLPVPTGPVVDRPPVPARVRRTVLAVFAVSGFATLALEVVWFRMLLGYLPSSAQAFTVMLATVLLGIAGGSAAATVWLRRPRRLLRSLAVVEAGVGLAALVSLALVGQTFAVSRRLAEWTGAGGAEAQLALVASVLAILPATLLMGAAFPIGLALYADGDHRGRAVGRFYAMNTGGAIAGALVAGFALVPLLGTRASVLALAGLLAGSALVLQVAAPDDARLRVLAPAVAVAFAAAAFVAPDPLAAARAGRFRGETVLWSDEGVQASVSVHQRGPHRVMYLDGMQQASTEGPVVALHRLVGALPMALHPDPQRALVIGLGGGVTAGAVAAFRATTVEVVELSPEVVEAATLFDDANQDVLDAPNVTIRIDDGRNVLLLDDTEADVVTADIIQPEHAGAGKVWSVEYWRLVRSRLAEDGLFLQWIGSYRTPEEYRLILRSFLSVFPEATLWADGQLLVGAVGPLTVDRDRFAVRLADPVTRAALAAAGIGSWDDLVALATAGPADLAAFAGDGPVLTDDRPRIEYDPGDPTGAAGVVDLDPLLAAPEPLTP